jgi:hypothetical protein
MLQLVAGRVGRPFAAVLHFDVDRRGRVLPGERSINLGAAFDSGQEVTGIYVREAFLKGGSPHCFCQLLHVGVHVEIMSLRQCSERGSRSPAFSLLNPSELPLSEPLEPRLRKTRFLAKLADRSPIPRVKGLAPLLSLSEFFRIDRLKELIPTEMNVEVWPVDERTSGVDLEVPRHIMRLASQKQKFGSPVHATSDASGPGQAANSRSDKRR